jgi:uncharacterized membrane protein
MALLAAEWSNRRIRVLPVITFLRIFGSLYLLVFAVGCFMQVAESLRTGRSVLGLDREQLVLGLPLWVLPRLGVA